MRARTTPIMLAITSYPLGEIRTDFVLELSRETEPIGDIECVLLSLPIQMLVSSINTLLDTHPEIMLY